jgi:branched-chain amino acid transport system substrate-binding protein
MCPLGEKQMTGSSIGAMNSWRTPFRLVRKSLLALGVGTILLAGAAHVEAQPASGEPINIGAIVSITGPAAGLGALERDVLVLSEKVVNQTGGVRGRLIKIIIRDDTTNPDTALSQANELIHTQKVVALLGSTITAPTVAIGGVSSKAGVPQIAFSGIGPAIERERKCVFHLPPGQELNARAMLEYARSIKATKLALLHDAGFGNLILAEMRKHAASYGVTLVATEKFEAGATDTTTQAAKIKAAQPDAIFIAAATATPFRDIRRLQMTQPIIAHQASSTYEYVSAMGTAADNIIFAEFLVGEDPLPQQKEFVEAYRKEFNRLPKNVDTFVWDGVQVLVQALDKVGPDAGGEKICAALRGTYKGVYADYDFAADDMNGIKISSFVFSKLVNGKFTRLPFRAAQ